ncbi:MAG: hypothetical protein P1U56_11440 [Saprospiraceae bacterium]|nr:hypothetical protein [Saprospiraceae bacterium]
MSFLERTILEKHYIKGEALFDANAVLEVVEVEKSLWSVMIKDNGILEVEIQNPNTKKQKSTCECPTFTIEKSCEHIATALLHLRKEEALRVKKRKEKSIQKKSFNLKTILDHVETEDLIKFVRTYAQSDRMFGILLKASFARKIDLTDNSKKYESILSTLIKPITTEQKVSNSADLRIGLKVIHEFLSQLEDALSLNQLEEGFFILESCLPKIHYLYSNYNRRTDDIILLIKKFHAQIDLLYQNQLAPELLSKLDLFIINLFQKSYYNHLPQVVNIYHIAEAHERNEVIRTLNEVLQTTPNAKIKQINKTVITALQIQNGYYEYIQSTNDVIISALQFLVDMDRSDTAIEFMENYRETKPKNKKLEFTLAITYKKLGLTSKFHHLCTELYVSNDDVRYYRMLKEQTNEKSWEPIKSMILAEIERTKPSSVFKARFYEKESMTADLISLLEEECDLRHIMKYDFNLYKTNYIDLERIYHRATKKYLDNHAGSIATRFIEEIFYHLTQIRAHKMVTSLKNYISSEYPHRLFLSSFS